MKTPWRSVRTALGSVQIGISEFLAVAGPIFRPFAPALCVSVGFIFLETLIASIYPLLYGKLTDAVVSRNAHLAFVMLGVLVAQGLVGLLIGYVRERYEIEKVDWALNLDIMNASLERILGFSLAQSAQMHSGKTRDIIRNGRNAMRRLVYLTVFNAGPRFLKLTMALIALMWTNIYVGGSATTGSVLYMAFAAYLFVRFRKAFKSLQNRDNENGKMFADTLANIEVVVTSAGQRRAQAAFAEDGQAFIDQARTFWRGAIGWFYLRNTASFFWKYSVMGLTAWLLFRGHFSFGTFVALTQWSMQAVNSTGELGELQREISENWAHSELYVQLLRRPVEITSMPDALQPERLRGHIAFEGVTFSYEPRASDDPLRAGEPIVALDNVTFDIPSGQKVAFVGESGAGKSTVAYALMRARDPQAGSILMDGTDLRSLDLDAVKRRIGYVAQHPRLFDRTLRYNLLFGLNDGADVVSDDRLRELLAMVKLERLADKGGLDRRLGENGHTLSGGERQRLCIARALIKDPDVLIFDEATSSLDPVNEKKVQEAIDVARGRTKLIIAHRYSTIRDVDRILVFDSGHLIDDGTHDELLSQCPYYRTLLEQQGLL